MGGSPIPKTQLQHCVQTWKGYLEWKIYQSCPKQKQEILSQTRLVHFRLQRMDLLHQKVQEQNLHIQNGQKGRITKGSVGKGATKPARPGKVTFKTLYGSWGLRFPKLNFNIVFKPGKVTLNGKSIRVVPSKNKKYSVKLGWFTFVYRGWTYYIRKYRNRIYTFRMDKKGRITKGSVGKGAKGGKEARPAANLAGQWRVTWSDRSVARYSIKKIGSTF